MGFAERIPTREQGECRQGLCSAFSLVEVNLAIFVVAIGLLTLFSLFPVGLKQGEEGHEDTQTAMFAGYVLDGIRANAMGVSSTDWNNQNPDVMTVQGSPLLDGLNVVNGADLPLSVLNPALEFPKDSGLYMRYVIGIGYDAILDLYNVTLWVQGGQYGITDEDDFKGIAKVFYTELFYSGMP